MNFKTHWKKLAAAVAAAVTLAAPLAAEAHWLSSAQEKEISLGTNVTEVLSWVAAGSADCGFTYRTDAMQEADNVVIVEGLAPATYPVGVIASSQKQDAAKTFEEFLGTEEALEQFTAYGFTLPEE